LAKVTLVARLAFIFIVILIGFVTFTEANPLVHILFFYGIIRFAFSAEIL
jgi:hypothetical protein